MAELKGLEKGKYQSSDSWLMHVILPMIPWLVIFALIWFFVFRQIRAAGGGIGMLGNFGRSRHRVTSPEHVKTTFKDVAGIDEAKQEVTEIIEFLKNPKKFQRLGGRIPRGVLLVGEPGTGKTLLARAIAGEASVPFFSISGSDFVEMFVGVGASRVRDLFRQAKENSPCIIFLDEIDAVGRRRGGGFTTGGHDEREQTLNAILVEMDGFDTNDQVIVIAATNRADVLDPALARPGRFDRQISVPLPDLNGRFEILKVHARKIKIKKPLNDKLKRLARGTSMVSGADLAAIINEAAIAATMENKKAVDFDDLEEARDRIRFGRARKSRIMSEAEKKTIAWHEAGHAVVQYILPDADPLHKVSIIPRGMAGGMTAALPEQDRHLFTYKHGNAQLQIFFAGRISEEKFCDDVSSGAADDIKRATQLARTMVCDWGMSKKLGPVRWLPDEPRSWPNGMGREFSDATAEDIDREIRAFIDDAYTQASGLIDKNTAGLKAIAEALLKYETLDASEVALLLKGQPLDKPDLPESSSNSNNHTTEPVTPK